jgi:hypothetical protein
MYDTFPWVIVGVVIELKVVQDKANNENKLHVAKVCTSGASMKLHMSNIKLTQFDSHECDVCDKVFLGVECKQENDLYIHRLTTFTSSQISRGSLNLQMGFQGRLIFYVKIGAVDKRFPVLHVDLSRSRDLFLAPHSYLPNGKKIVQYDNVNMVYYLNPYGMLPDLNKLIKHHHKSYNIYKRLIEIGRVCTSV